MRRLILLLAISLVCIVCFAAPVMAADPPDTNVNVNVASGGDVDLNVGISSGGNVNVTVDGTDFDDIMGLAQDAYWKSTEPRNGLWDFRYYWQRTGIGDAVQSAFAQIWSAIDTLFASNAKLIEELNTANSRIDDLENRIKALEATP